MTAELSTARLLWQMGDWSALVALPEALQGKSTAAATASQIELALYRLQALFLTGAVDEARALAAALRSNGVSRPALARALLSGAGSSLARARLINGQPEPARRILAAAVALNPEAGESALVESLRFESEQRRLTTHRLPARTSLPYVDVIGPSGSGKTTLIQALAEEDGFEILGKPDLTSTSTSDTTHMIYSFMLNHTTFICAVSDALQCTRDSEKLQLFLKDMLIKYISTQPVHGSLLLFDEGFVCRANSLFAYTAGPLDENKIKSYLRSIPLPFHVITLFLSPRVCLERLEERPRGLPKRMSAMSIPDRLEVLQKMNRITEIVIEELGVLGIPMTSFREVEAVPEMVEKVIVNTTRKSNACMFL